jgi:hypothetical protein
LPANFAMPVAVPSTPGDDAGGPPGAGLAARVAAGPGLWEDEDWLADLRRESLPESLLADGTIAAGAAAEHAHKQERALNAEVTALCLVTGALFPVLGYDSVLALVFSMPGLPARPGTPVPTGPAYSKARARSGEAPARAIFEADAARTDIPAGPDGTAFGLEITQIDGTTLELFSDPLLAEEFGVPAPGAKPLLRLVGLLHSGTRRWKAAVIGRYLDGENALADGLQDAFGPGQLNLADRGFLSMDRWIRFSGTGADLPVADETSSGRRIIRLSGGGWGPGELIQDQPGDTWRRRPVPAVDSTPALQADRWSQIGQPETEPDLVIRVDAFLPWRGASGWRSAARPGWPASR